MFEQKLTHSQRIEGNLDHLGVLYLDQTGKYIQFSAFDA
jgi:hypothetical protein